MERKLESRTERRDGFVGMAVRKVEYREKRESTREAMEEAGAEGGGIVDEGEAIRPLTTGIGFRFCEVNTPTCETNEERNRTGQDLRPNEKHPSRRRQWKGS